jgi:hypothetical protein
MVKKEQILLIILFLLVIKIVDAGLIAEQYDSDSPPTTTEDWNKIEPSSIPPEDVNKYFDKLSTTQKSKLSSNQLAAVDITKYGDLGQYDTTALKMALGQKGFNIQSLQGDLTGAKIEGNNLILADGSSIDLKSTNQVSVETSGGEITYLSDSRGTILINAENVHYSSSAITVANADSITYEDAEARAVVDFTAETGTFSVGKANIVIVERLIVFDKIKNGTFVLQNGKLMSASVTSDKANNSVKFPNLVTGSSQYISVNYDLDKSFGINYRTERDKVDFRLDEGIDLLLLNSRNISFTSYDNSTFTIIGNRPPIYRFKNGVLNYSSSETTEQLESTCGLSEANIDLALGFVRTALSPANITVLCSGSRYNLIDKIIKEKSYSIYNIGENNYYLGFEKGTTLINFKAAIYSENFGFIYKNKNIILNKIIEYDRIPNKYQFPALSEAEYISLPLEFKKVVASTHPSNKINITGEERINLFMENREMAIPINTVLFETNSGFFNIKEKKKDENVRRFAEFNKEMLYPDYIAQYETFFGYTTPLITIENKTLTQSGVSDEGEEKVVKLYTPDTEESKSFLQWLKGRAIIKDVTEFIRNVLNR